MKGAKASGRAGAGGGERGTSAREVNSTSDSGSGGGRNAREARVLALHTDSFGGRGGIAAANREFLRALCALDGVGDVVALPRVAEPSLNDVLPERLEFHEEAIGGRATFGACVLRQLAERRAIDIVWCGHLHLVPLSLLAGRISDAPVLLHLHGIEAWAPTDRWLVDRFADRVDGFVAVSETTAERFSAWSGVSDARGSVVPNTIDFRAFSPGPKPRDLLDRYGLEERFVLMTLGRLAGRERRKGFDRVLEALPLIAELRADASYLIAGSGPDRNRLEQKAERLGVRDRVVFTGYVDEEKKADYYRLADRFLLPSEGEGFGIVLLEAMASGVAVVASERDGGREAVVGGELGTPVDPREPEEVARAAVDERTPPSPGKVRARFGREAYRERVRRALEDLLGPLRSPPGEAL